MAKGAKPLGDILIKKGFIDKQKLDAAINATQESDMQLGEILVQWAWITDGQLQEALHTQAPPPPPPPPPLPPPVQAGYVPQSPPVAPDLTMDNLQTSKFKIDLKTLIWIGSLLVTGMTTYFGFMSELNSRLDALEDVDDSAMIELERKFTALENKFTPIGEGVYTVDPTSTWPPSRTEYNMKDQMARNSIAEIQKDLEEIKKDIEKLEDK